MVLDPLTALGLASNVVQLIGFAGTIVSQSMQLYRSTDGALEENVELQTVTEDLMELEERLRFSLKRGNDNEKGAGDEKGLEDLISGCVAIARQMLMALEKVKLQGSKHRSWKALRKAIQGMWSKSEIESLRNRLDLYKEELEMHLLVSLREQISSEQVVQSSRFQALDTTTQEISRSILQGQDVFAILLSQQTQQLDARIVEEHRRTRAELKQIIINGMGGKAPSRLEFSSVNEGGHIPWAETSLYDQRKMRDVRDSLAYPEMRERSSTIAKAHTNTFGWAFEAPDPLSPRKWDSFANWLKHGDSVYWISGKPGSGKSTLLKFLSTDERTKEALQVWSGSDSICVADFYFWNSGKAMQKSEEGFLRGLLLTVLRKCPQLLPVVLRHEATDANRNLIKKGQFEWSMVQLRQMMKNFLQQDEVDVKLLLLVDGLDEYDGDHFELANWFMSAPSSRIKIVVSSRPWNAFREVFSSVKQLRVQDLTYQDITTFVQDKLQKVPQMEELMKNEPEKSTKLIADIVTKADGVFLWVQLVVTSLLEGLRNHDTLSDLHARVSLLPANLKNLYVHILKNVDPLYRNRQSRYILMRQALTEPPMTLAFSLADTEEPQAIPSRSYDLMTRGEALDRCEEMERRLQASCAGLIEVDYREKTILTDHDRKKPLDNLDYYKSAYGSSIQFIHRTARDFFEGVDISAQLQSEVTKANFDPYLALFRCSVLRILRLPSGYGPGSLAKVTDAAAKFANLSQTASQQTIADLAEIIEDRGVPFSHLAMIIATDQACSGAAPSTKVWEGQETISRNKKSLQKDGDDPTQQKGIPVQESTTLGDPTETQLPRKRKRRYVLRRLLCYKEIK